MGKFLAIREQESNQIELAGRKPNFPQQSGIWQKQALEAFGSGLIYEGSKIQTHLQTFKISSIFPEIFVTQKS